MGFAKNKERIDADVVSNKLACVGLMMVERFEDGSEDFHIIGYYKNHRDSAVDSAIELTVYARNRWRELEE